VPLATTVVGITTDPVVHEVDSRWLMAYAASVGAVGPAYLDTTRSEGITAHPVFPVALEWPAVLALRDEFAAAGLERDEAARGVHLTHDLVVHRAIRPGDRLLTTATVEALHAHRAGTLAVLSLHTATEGDGEPVATSTMGTLYRDVAAAGAPTEPGPTPDRSDPPHPTDPLEFTIDVAASAAHVYTECSRIWNPIHTDARTAARAGLPGIILHGTATLAWAVTGLIDRRAGGDPTRVTGLSCRFAAPVTMPNRLTVTADGPDPAGPTGPGGDAITFTVADADGTPVLRHGRLALG
jgi:acyl dehydratase